MGQRRVHGDSLLVTSRRNTKMLKTITLACLAAVAFAEPEAEPKAAADPYLLYGGYGHHRYYGKREAEAEAEPKAAADPYLLYGGYRGYGGHLGYAGLGYGGYGYGHHGYYGKREAEPKAAADPYLLYGGYGGHLGYAGLGYARHGYPYGAGYAYYG